jgi:hypothetical protein
MGDSTDGKFLAKKGGPAPVQMFLFTGDKKN